MNMSLSLYLSVLLGAVCVCLQVHAHVDISVIACKSGDVDAEDELELDGDEVVYVDFVKKEAVITLPEFAGQWTAPGRVQQAQAEHQICLNNLDVAVQAEKNPPEQIDAPDMSVYPRNKVVQGRDNILICAVTNFYPPPVNVSWTRNNQPVKQGVTLSRYYPNSDFTFRQYSTLAFTPQEGDVYSCTVQHKGLQGPETRFWEPKLLTDSDLPQTVYCGVGLTLGLIGVGVGTFFLVKGNNCK